MDWILKLPEGKQGSWVEYWNGLAGTQAKSTGAGILEGMMFPTGSSIRGDYSESPTTGRFMHDYNQFVEWNPKCEPVRRLKLQKVYRAEDLAEIGKRILQRVHATREKKQKLKPFVAGLKTVHYTRQGYYWEELHEILLRFFFAYFAETNGYKIIEWG